VIEAPNGHPTVAGIKDGDFYVVQLQRETGGTRWVYTTNGADNDDDIALSLAKDGAHIYAAGYVDNGINGLDAYIVKLDTLGNLQWEYTYNGPFNSDDVFRKVLITADGGLVVGGYSVGGGTGRDILVVKLNPATGDTLWTFAYDSPYSMDDDLRAMVWDSGTVYACANSYSSPTNRDILVLRLDEPTGIAEREGRPVQITVESDGLVLTGRGKASLYDVSGRKRVEVKVNGNRRLRPGRGIWFVRFNGQTYRVILR